MIREMSKQDFVLFWPTFHQVVAAQETYAFEPDLTCEQAFTLWCETTLNSFVYEENGEILGSYYIKSNAMGPSSHICNCGYMVSTGARGKGIARKMCEHSQHVARESGFSAMQFNSVVSTNRVAVQLWQQLGFAIVGTLPKAYRHAKLGLVDSYVMYKWLNESNEE